MAEHIDNNRLHSDLRYRFEYLSKFLNFTSDDITMLNTFAPVVFPLVPVVVDAMYRKLFSFDITKRYFIICNEGFEGFLPKNHCGVTLESAQMEIRKDMLSVYLKRILTQRDWNDAFLQYLLQIAQVHVDQAGPSMISVDYMHINALLGLLEHSLINLLCSSTTFDETTKHGILMAINKFFWIQNDFFTMYYLNSTQHSTRAIKKSETAKATKCCPM